MSLSGYLLLEVLRTLSVVLNYLRGKLHGSALKAYMLKDGVKVCKLNMFS